MGDGARFTRGPRAELAGPGQWASHQPARATGPNAASCVACHAGAELGGGGDGSGVNVIRDPLLSAAPGQFIQRNTPHLFGPGALQRLAEEVTLALRGQRDAGVAAACEAAAALDVPLSAKGVDFGSIRVDCTGVVDDSGVEGVDPDLLVRPFVRLYGDLKRHDMGPGLAESIDETGHGASVWMTKELWGVASTAPFLHDGRAMTLLEAPGWPRLRERLQRLRRVPRGRWRAAHGPAQAARPDRRAARPPAAPPPDRSA